MSEPRWTLNRNEGMDTIHRNPREECNTDDVKGREAIDAQTAAAMLSAGTAKPCQHCMRIKDSEL